MLEAYLQSKFFWAGLALGVLSTSYLVWRQRRLAEPLREFLTKLLCSGFLWQFLIYKIFWLIRRRELYPESTSMAYIFNWSLVFLIMLFFTLSYMSRAPYVHKAKGFKEVVFPLICAFLPYGLIVSVSWLPNDSHLFWFFKPFYIETPRHWNGFSILFILVGQSIVVAGMYKLRRSFSILTEARMVIQGGIYRWIRHPIYVGHSLSMLGICFLAPSWSNILVTAIFLVLERYRASIEEKKLVSVFPAYKEYMKTTGAYFPKIRSSLSS